MASGAGWWASDSKAALGASSVLGGALGAAAVYLPAGRFASRELAAFAALAFAADPLVWAHGEIALPYVVLALGSGGLALLFRDTRHGSERRPRPPGRAVRPPPRPPPDPPLVPRAPLLGRRPAPGLG